MHPARSHAWAAFALLLVAMPASALGPLSVVMGPSRDGSLNNLQQKVDRLIGPGRVDVRTDYIGGHPGDSDPFFWTNTGLGTVTLTLVDRKSPHGVIGWYDESSGIPVLRGTLAGVLLEDWRARGTQVSVRIPSGVARFGFYVFHQGGDDPGDQGRSVRYYSDRAFNDPGPFGSGAIHAPAGGDVQMLVYDLSPWWGPNSWLVACEYSDSGCPVGQGPGESDNDFADVVFTVTGAGATPTEGRSFGQLKSLYR